MSDTPEFIPAKESPLFIRIFHLYCKFLFWRRFSSVHVDTRYEPSPDSKTIYYMNHNSWWDGLIPFYLNQFHFRQNARGMMEGRQLRNYSFFRKIGVFSIDLDSPRSILTSLRYSVESLQRPNSALYIFPQGEIVPFSTGNIQFKKGIGWLSEKVPDAKLVPVGIYIHTMRSDKPELHIRVGEPSSHAPGLDKPELLRHLEEDLRTLLDDMIAEIKTD